MKYNKIIVTAFILTIIFIGAGLPLGYLLTQICKLLGFDSVWGLPFMITGSFESVAIVAIILSFIGLREIKITGEKGKNLAIATIVITGLQVLLLLLMPFFIHTASF